MRATIPTASWQRRDTSPIRGVVDITTTGVKIVVGVVRGVFELGWDVLRHL